MNIRKLKKAVKNSSGFLTFGVFKHGYYAVNESDKIIFHKKYLEVKSIDFSTLLFYREITRLIIE